MPAFDQEFSRRFSAKVVSDSDCLRWTGAIKSNGYGVCCFQRRYYQAHRVAFILSGRSIPDDAVLDHLCRNHWCVNPDHLEPVSKSENAKRGIPGQIKTHCRKGHELAAENTYEHGGRRQCRACAIARSSARWERTKHERTS